MTTAAVDAPERTRPGARGIERALDEAQRLLLAADSHAVMLSELGAIELPPVAAAEPMQMRAVASLYLASTLEAAGLIEAADDLARLVRSGVLRADLGAAAPLVVDFYNERASRANSAERIALFARLFGAPAGPVDVAGSVNEEFEELLLDVCDAIIDAADRGSARRIHAAGDRLAENVASSASDMVLLMARDIIASLSDAIAILNHPQVRAALSARTLWDAVAAIDRRFRRPARPTLSYLRRGRAGMTVMAWLAEVLDDRDGGDAAPPSNDMVVDAAVDWVDETLAIIRAEEGRGSSQSHTGSARPGSAADAPAWLDLAR